MNLPQKTIGFTGYAQSRPRMARYSRLSSANICRCRRLFVMTPPCTWWKVASPSSTIGSVSASSQARVHVSRFTSPPPGPSNRGSYPPSSCQRLRDMNRLLLSVMGSNQVGPDDSSKTETSNSRYPFSLHPLRASS